MTDHISSAEPISSTLVQNEIAALSELSRAALVELWSTAYGRPPPKGLSRRLLEYAAAYHLQSKTFGGLRPTVRRKLCRLAGSGHLNSPRDSRAAPSKRLSPGSRLVRDWRGRTYTVDILEAGFQWDGRHYGSLSQVALAITGARWSGPRFFGL
jgi:hypothetical protein